MFPIPGSAAVTPRWEVVLTGHVEGDRQDAEVVGLEVAKSYVPEPFYLGSGDRPRRSVFRVQDGSWLVKLRGYQTEVHFRVSVGELVHGEEEIPVPLPECKPVRRTGTFASLRFLITGSF